MQNAAAGNAAAFCMCAICSHVPARFPSLALLDCHLALLDSHPMSTMIAEVYDALKEAGASEEKAKAAAMALADYSNRFDRIDLDLGSVKGEVPLIKSDVAVLKTDVAGVKADVAVLK